MVIRPIRPEDKGAITKWCPAPEVFYEAGRKGKVIEDSEGKPVMFALFTDIERVDILFDPNETPIRTAKAMMKLNESVDKEVVTESVATQLIGFIEKMGFKSAPNTYVRGAK